MYKILGGDGKEYGPVSTETLRQWINEGRANAQTKVQPEGGSGWVALAQVPEFADLQSAPQPSAAPSAIPSQPGVVGSFNPAAGNAAQTVSGPAIGLIVTAGLGAVAQLLGIVMNSLGVGMAGMQESPEMPAWVHTMSGTVGIVFNIIGLIMSGVVLFGALKMKKLESYGFAMTTAIIAMVPCVSPCCWVGLPIGIWALVALNKPGVKESFK